MFQYLSIITTITGLFTLLDLFVEKQAKAKVAEYVFDSAAPISLGLKTT